jgi:GDPmannose 4,6-dehydratase
LHAKHYSEIFRKDLTNSKIAQSFLSEIQPSIIFHLASVNINSEERARSEGATEGNWARAVQVGITDNVLNYIRQYDFNARFLLAGSSRMFSAKGSKEYVSRDATPTPTDSYGVYKTEAHALVMEARLVGLNVGTAILFNHESHLRKPGFLFPHLASEITQILKGSQKEIRVMDVNAMADWHAAEDTVKGLIKMAEQDKMENYIFASGNATTVGDLVSEYFRLFQASKAPSILSTAPRSDGGVLIGDIGETTKNLDWKPVIPVISILDKIVRQQIASKSHLKGF